jgi:uncharacterized protein (DUF1330 family)
MHKMARRDTLIALPAALALSGCAQTPPAPAAAPQPKPWTDQPAYSIVRVDVRDGKTFGEYVAGHTPTVAAAGGRFLVAGALPQAIEGEWPARRMVIHQWPKARAFLDWYDSAAYRPWKALRHGASSADVLLAQGVAGSEPAAEVGPAFVVIDVDVRDGPAFGRYVQGHLPGLQAAGGIFVVAGGRVQSVEGAWSPKRLVVHRWPSAEAFRRWYDSAEYRPWRDLRWGAARAQVALVEGLSEKTKRERRLP